MPEYLKDIGTNLVAEAIAWTLVLLAVGFVTVTRQGRKRRRLLRFLGISHKPTPIHIYLSSLDLKPGAVVDLEGERTIWSGISIPEAEFLIMPDIDRWLSPLTKRSSLFEYLLDLLPPRFRLFLVQIKYSSSPRRKKDLQLTDCTAILIGGPLNNVGTKTYFDENRTLMRSDDWHISVEVTKGRLKGKVLGANVSRDDFFREDAVHPGKDVAVLEKLWDEERNVTVFIASGTGLNGTMAAVRYLIANWENLQRKYEESHFSICLECPHRSVDVSGYLNSSVLLELPQSTLPADSQ